MKKGNSYRVELQSGTVLFIEVLKKNLLSSVVRGVDGLVSKLYVWGIIRYMPTPIEEFRKREKELRDSRDIELARQNERKGKKTI